MAHIRASLAACFALLLLWLPALAADTTVDAGFEGPSLDLMPYVQTVDSEGTALSVELPAAQNGAFMELEPRGPESVHRWGLVTISNPGTAPRDLVVAVPHQGFAGSRIVWPKAPGSRLYNITFAGAADTAPVDAAGADAVALRLAPGATLSLAMELKPVGLSGLTLWKRTAFEAQSRSFAFTRGVLLGIAGLMTLAMLGLYAIRANAVFPYAALFGVASVLFIALQSGYLPAINNLLPVGVALKQEAQAIVESLMLTGLLLCLVSFVDLRNRWPAPGNGLLMAAGLTLALPVYGWFEPSTASFLARILFAATVAGGLFVMIAMWLDGVPRARASLVIWSLIALWTILAGLAVFADGNRDALDLLVTGGLALILVIMGFTLTQFAFNRGFVNQRFLEEAGRRALALAGSRQFVWDWEPEDRMLHVSDDLEQSLGHRPGLVAHGGMKAWYDLIHPADRAAYDAATEAAERRGSGSFSQEFRLRRADGTYRWFLLRARALPAGSGEASRCIGTLTDVTHARRAQDHLLSDAVYDRVTGLPNRALLADRLGRIIAARGGEASTGLYLILVELDRFRSVNDGLGHEAADALLTVTGNRLLELAGPDDTVARLPGAQFAVLFNRANNSREIIPFTETIRHSLSKPVSMRPREVFLTASIGVTGFRDKSQTAESMLKEAAVALYEAKRRGKDAVEFFRLSMRDDRTELVVIEADLRRALERGEIEVYYQPIARLTDLDLAGFEALVRWRRPTHGLVEPEQFIPVAEATGIIHDIGRYVLNEAARQLGIWQRAFRPGQPLFVAVNMSSSQLLGADLIDDVRQIMGREGVERGTLKIEVTESMVMERPEAANQVLGRLQQLGVGLACDDFGTGHSSLANLRNLPFDTLKVDRSFIEPDPEDGKAASILESILSLAHRLDMTVVAEGISNQEQIERLEALGCDYGQGFFIGEPMTAKQVVDALSGLPYAASRNKTAMTVLWERVAGTRGPDLAPRDERVTAPPPLAMKPGLVPPTPPPSPLPPREDTMLAPPPPSLGRAPMAPRLPRNGGEAGSESIPASAVNGSGESTKPEEEPVEMAAHKKALAAAFSKRSRGKRRKNRTGGTA
ncbi:EAL domain-containing protein [soil metagenome]